MVSFSDLPAELIDCILLYLTWRDINSCYRASRIFHVVSDSRLDWLMYSNTSMYRLIKHNIDPGICYKVEHLNIYINENIFRLAIRYNSIKYVDYFIDHGFTINSLHINYAISCCHVNMVKHLLLKYDIHFDKFSPFTAVRYCLVHELEDLRSLGLIYNDSCVEIAIKREAYFVVLYLYNLGYRATSLVDVGRSGNIKIAKLLLQYDERNSNLALNIAARNGHLDMVIFLHSRCGVTGTQYAIHTAARYNYQDVVKYLHFIGTESYRYITFDFALVGCGLEVCMYLMLMGHYCSRRGILEIAKRGDIDIMRYIYNKQRPYFHATEVNPIDIATTYGHYELVRYLVRFGYPIHGTSLHQVVLDGDQELFTLLL